MAATDLNNEQIVVEEDFRTKTFTQRDTVADRRERYARICNQRRLIKIQSTVQGFRQVSIVVPHGGRIEVCEEEASEGWEFSAERGN